MSDSTPPLPAAAVVIGLGARTASGLIPLQVTLCARTGKMRPRESHIIDKHGEPVATVRLASIPDNVIGIERFLQLATPAFVQAAAPWVASRRRANAAVPRLPVFVSLPEEARPGFDPRLATHFLPALEERSTLAIDRASSRLFFACRAGGIAAIEAAIEAIREGAPAAVAGGVDSYFDPDVLEHLDAEMRLHTANAENGFLPGEGAAFLLLAPRTHTSTLPRYAQVVSAAVEREPRPWGSPDPCLGEGITKAVRRALSVVPERRIPRVLTDVANERHRVDEWSYAFARAHRSFTPDVVHDQPLLKTGDVGAASAPLLAVMAATEWQIGSPVGDAVLIAAHSDGPERGAMVLSPAMGE